MIDSQVPWSFHAMKLPVNGRRTETEGRIRVVTLIDTIKSAGAERLATQIATLIDPEQFESVLCVSRWERRERSAGTDSLLADFEERGGRILPLHRRSRLDLWHWRPLLRALRSETDILHSHVFTSNAWGSVLGRLARVPVVISHEHTWSYEGAPLRRFVDRDVISRLSDVFLACSREDRRRMIELERIKPEKLRLIPNGIEAPQRGQPHDVRQELGIPASAPLAVAVGRLTPDKGFDVLIEAAAELRDDFPDLRVLIAGGGDDLALLNEMVDREGLTGTVTLLGVRSDVPDLLDAADVAVSSSRVEGSPLAVLEQMEASKAIVATAVGGVPDMIDDGVHGLLVENGDQTGLARAIGELLRDRRRAEELGRRAQERRRSEFDLSVMVGRVEDLYRELWSAARASR
jgi:glycosyltransferase involved in cell wall biosynthesis